MKNCGCCVRWIGWVLVVLCSSVVTAQVPATTPTNRLHESWWSQRHEAKVAEAQKGGWKVVFIGDSITQGWEVRGRAVWEKYYAYRNALNLGFSGDRTEHVLWRLMNGEIEGVSSRLVILMLGTNNTGHRRDPPEQTAEGMQKILEILKTKMPEARILLLAVFPRDEKPDGMYRKINDQLNERLKALADGERVIFLNINDRFLQPDGTLSREIMPDFLHPNEQGYRIWAEAMEPHVARLLGETPVAP
jgi:lysophospholipase L1-like esterase